MANQKASIVKSGTQQAADTGDVVTAEVFNATTGFQYNGTALAASNLTQDGTGTSSTTFQLASGASGPKLKNNSGDVQLRNAADNAFAALDALQVKIAGTNMLDANGAAKVQTGVCGAGLVPNSGAIDVNPDGATLEINSDVLRMKDAGTTAAKLEDAVADAIPTQTISHDSEGTVAADTFRVTIQVKDVQANNLSGYFHVEFWISDTQWSATLTSQAPTVTFQTGASLQQLTANKHYRAITDSTGKLQLNIALSGDLTIYVQSRLGSGVLSTTLDYN